ncbi:MAG: HAMP domain-containing protein [Ardenticatenaceae bacterium]|nr:HAMP domain-containing protein [Anaerolineales bacterium]MCB9007825.1 HAMP domain-containing protein [Ardenticatenaceae bacterium]
MMRSLSVKLTLAFLAVGIAGAALVAFFVGFRTRIEFNSFVDTQSHLDMAVILGNYYEENGGWEDVNSFIHQDSAFSFHEARLILLDADNIVLYGFGPENDGKPYPFDRLPPSQPIEVNGETVGQLILNPDDNYISPPDRFSPEDSFLRNVNLAAVASAITASVFALALGSLLARTLTRPIRELTAVTQSMADGQLGQQVAVRTKDEIGELASSFNQMSHDLADASRLRKQMTADIAHDLRTPLTVLRGYTEGLKKGSLAGSEKLFNIMHEEVLLLQHLVEDLRTLSLADAGELKLNKRAIDPKALLERTGLAYIMQAEEKGLALRVDAPSNLPAIFVDGERMTQVLNNLVSNALRYTSTGEIVLSGTAVHETVQLQIKDSGVGIPAEELPYIFNRFYRADQSRHRTVDGASGLGLAIAKAIVDAHDGKITAVSNPGAGTTFIITLPRFVRGIN